MILKKLYWIPLATITLGVYGCQTATIKPDTAKQNNLAQDNLAQDNLAQATFDQGKVRQEARWYNAKDFDDIDSIGDSYYGLVFERSYAGVNNDKIEITSCVEVASLGDSKIIEREFSRWNLLKVNCEAAIRYFDAPEKAVSYWPANIDFALLKTFPATATPYLGGQGLDGRHGALSELEPTLTLLASTKHNVKVSYNAMVVDYVVMARGDFNRDGYQDLFVRMDWYVEDAFGEGSDWVVITKRASDDAPMVLWRR